MEKESYELSEKNKSGLTSNDLNLKSPSLSKEVSNQQSTQLTQSISMNYSLNFQTEKDTSN